MPYMQWYCGTVVGRTNRGDKRAAQQNRVGFDEKFTLQHELAIRLPAETS
jgi:hypothetical protein